MIDIGISFFLSVILTFIGMEVMANLTHRYLMHGILWGLHRDHHHPGAGFWQRNDWFFVIFALPSIVLLSEGLDRGDAILFGIGIGQCLYGLCYVLIHDLYVHNRFGFKWPKVPAYMQRLRRHHRVHHHYIEKQGAKNFGFLWAPKDDRMGPKFS